MGGPPYRDIVDRETDEISVRHYVEQGIELCQQDKWQEGLELLVKVARKNEREYPLPGRYYSYLGYAMARFEHKFKEGLAMCRHGVKIEGLNPDNYLNLARTYQLKGRRRPMVTALQKGLAIDPRHLGLRGMRQKIGYRTRPVIPFLSRDSWINRQLGRARHDHREDKKLSS